VKIGDNCENGVPIENKGAAKVWDQMAPFEKTFLLEAKPKTMDLHEEYEP